jgi:mono/diheme cytochrome c family protein
LNLTLNRSKHIVPACVQTATTLLVMGALAVAGCVQELDTSASRGSLEPPPPPTESDAGLSTVILPGPPPFGFYDNSGNIQTSEDPCDATRAQATGMLETHCAGCHGGRTPGERAGNPPFDFLLDVPKLTSTFTSNTTPPILFVRPGDPDRSRIYQRAWRGEMPPMAQSDLPRLTISDISVLRHWISNCLGAKPASGGSGQAPAGDGGSAANGGGSNAADGGP